MSDRPLLTVLIPTYNEERNLPDCLASVAWVDEIFVVDSFSSDRTVEIARAAGARVVQHQYLNSANQKNWAIPQCTHRWVMVVDADERVTPALADEIRAALAHPGGPAAAAFSIPRDNWIFGHRIRHGGWGSDRLTRLFDRERARYKDLEVHADMQVDGPVARLEQPLEHWTYRTFDDYFEKFGRYTTWSANDLWKRGTRARWWHLLIKPWWRFLRMYLLKRGILDGVPGLILAGLSACTLFVRWGKLWAMGRAQASDARWPDGRRIVHAGAAIHDEREVIAGGKRGQLDAKLSGPAGSPPTPPGP
ncbi:MAG: glycosyltransferase family 2 protein [Planctomycetes bacterium]|nr:glycosyltransferase family 2 protein [Planctomycetota bacterium]